MSIYNQKNPDGPSPFHAVVAKCFPTETATYVASEAIQIFGGYGLTKRYSVEKMFRDARISIIADYCNVTIVATRFL